MRKITSFYYLHYPDNLPNDPLDAYSEVYVEVGGEDGTINNFDETFALYVYTPKSLKRHVEEKGYVILKSVIIVDRFDDESIEKALKEILENIEEFGVKIGV